MMFPSDGEPYYAGWQAPRIEYDTALVYKMAELARQAEERLAPANPNAIKLHLAELSLFFWRPDYTEQQFARLYNGYALDLGDYPEWLIVEACTHFRQTFKFFPKVAEFREWMDPRLAKVRLEFDRVRFLAGERAPRPSSAPRGTGMMQAGRTVPTKKD